MPKLKRFSKKNKLNTKNILISFAIIIGLLTIGYISKSYAIYKLQQDYDVIKNKIGSFSMGDVRLAVLVDGKEASEFPSYETNYKVESVECTNGVTASFDVENWQINIADMSATSTKCTVSFNSKETNEITPVNYTKTELVALNDEIKNTSAKELANYLYPVGSIYLSTTDSSVDDVVAKFGGTWVRYGEDTTLVGYKEGANEINTTGGAKTVTLATTNLPSHNHTISHKHELVGETAYSEVTDINFLADNFISHTHSIPSLSGTGTAKSAGEHTHNVYRTSGHAASGTNRYTAQGTSDSYKTTPAGEHTHDVTISTTPSTTGTCGVRFIGSLTGSHNHAIVGEAMTVDINSGNTGLGTAINVQNPYTVVYMYKRTA